MSELKRLVTALISDESVGRQMRFLAGPRQVGKTELSKQILHQFESAHFYYNWDQRVVRERYQQDPYFFQDDFKETQPDIP